MSRHAFVLGISAAAVLAAALIQISARAEGPAPDAETARIELGRRLFFDPAIGRQGRIGCASCHDPEHGFSDARALSLDETGELPRHSQPLTDLAGEGFHWDGEFDTVREIVQARVLARADVALAGLERAAARAELGAGTSAAADRDRLRERLKAGFVPKYYGDGRAAPTVEAEKPDAPEALVDARLSRSRMYAKGFERAFGSPEPTLAHVVDALDAYVGSLRSEESPFDRFLAGNERALGESARRGYAVFTGKAGCAECHLTEPKGGRAPLTDGKFHDTGVAWDPEKSAFSDRGAGAPRMRAFLDGRFKTPSLRDVARRPPYMHDARFSTLEQVVRYYDGGGTPHMTETGSALDVRIRPLGLTDGEVKDVVAFLESLTGRDRAGLGAPSRDRAKTLVVSVVDLTGARQPQVRIRATPAGDRLKGGTAGAAARTYVTDANGEVRIPWPLATHLALASADSECIPLDLVPDYLDRIQLTVIGAGRTAYALPTGICEQADALIARRIDSRASAVTLECVHRMQDGRSVYVAKGRSDTLTGRYDLTSAATGNSVGAYELLSWVWTPDAAQFAGRLPPPPTAAAIPAELSKRIERLMNDGR